jgi:hypothetical protein
VSEAAPARRERGGIHLAEHLEAVKHPEIREVYAFWSGGELPELPKREIARQMHDVMSDEGTVYRRVRPLTRQVLDVLLLLLKRPDYRSDLPGLFRRVPGEDVHVALEYHEAEAGLKALVRRGFVGEWAERGLATTGRSVYAVPVELGDILSDLFRDETRTPRSVFSLAGFCASLGAVDRHALAHRFPKLSREATPGDVAAILDAGGAPARLLSIEPPELRELVVRTLDRDGGILLRSEYATRDGAKQFPWDRKAWSRALESVGVGTVARLALGEYGLSCEDEALVVFHEVVEDLLARAAPTAPPGEEILRPGGDLVADIQGFLSQVKRGPVRLTREGDVHKAARRRLEEGFVFPRSPLVASEDVWLQIRAATDHLGLVAPDAEGFLACRDESDRWSALPLDAKVAGLYRLALEAPGPRGRSLHLHELRQIVADLLKADPSRWWMADTLFTVARLRYLALLDVRKIKDRHRDRHFSAFVAGREGVRELFEDIATTWRRTLFLLGLVDAAADTGRVLALRLSPLGARTLGASTEAAGEGRTVVVTPDFEAVVLPEGDVSEVIHRLGGYAQRERNGDVVHFRFTRASIEVATAEGRTVDALLEFLAGTSRGPVPRNVEVTLRDWASAVSFATLERGIVLKVAKPEILDRVLTHAGMKPLVIRRLSPTEALLREEPKDRRLIAELRADGVYLDGP